MIKITEEQFEYFAENQEKLDSFMRAKRDITLEDWDMSDYYIRVHTIALKNEVSEFVNECRDIWKYWKDQRVNPDKLIDELVDVIHFLHLDFNKSHRNGIEFGFFVRQINEMIKEFSEHETYALLYKLETYNSIYTIYACTLLVAQHYGITMDDIKTAYDIKNAENFNRQKRGY